MTEDPKSRIKKIVSKDMLAKTFQRLEVLGPRDIELDFNEAMKTLLDQDEHATEELSEEYIARYKNK